MNKFIMLIGIPGAGKSTYAKTLLNNNTIILSSDALREELYNNVNDITHNAEIFKEMHKRTIENLKNNKTVIYDATNLNSNKRIKLLKTLQNISCEKECHIIYETKANCILHDKQRDRTVGTMVIEKMFQNFQFPNYYEGWDKIIIKHNLEKQTKLNFLPKTYNDYLQLLHDCELDKCINMPQDNPHHSYNLSMHMYKSYENISQKVIQPTLRIIMLLHDIGKAFCKKFDDNNIAHYFGHDNISGMYAFEVLTKYSDLKEETILEIVNLIQLHMRLFNKDGNKKLKELIGNLKFEQLEMIHEADINAC